jgi:hypothetical protein
MRSRRDGPFRGAAVVAASALLVACTFEARFVDPGTQVDGGWEDDPVEAGLRDGVADDDDAERPDVDGIIDTGRPEVGAPDALELDTAIAEVELPDTAVDVAAFDGALPDTAPAF